MSVQSNNPSESMMVWVSFLLIAMLAAILRFTNLDAVSFSQDESTMLQFTRGLLEKGYPYLQRGSSEVAMATYELVPYFIAPMVEILGWTEQAARLPAALFSMATLLLVFLVAKRWFDYRVALFAALLYAVSPWSIFWSNNCFYPSQFQFFGLLSIFLVHRLFCSESLKNRDYYVLSIVLSTTYLSWEASGLLFLVYGLLGLLIFWKQWSFLKAGHAWLAFSILVCVVLVQLIRRGLLQSPFLVTGTSRASIASPQLALNQPTYDPFYYIDNIFAAEQNIMLSVLFLLGIVFIKQDRNLRFIHGYVFLSLLVYAELLAVYAIRYMYFILPLFLIGASAASFKIFDRLGQTAVGRSTNTIKAISQIGLFIVITFPTLVLSSDGLKLSEMRASYRNSIEWELHPETARIDYRHVMLSLGEQYKPGDIIITRSPFLLELYTGLRGDYMLQSITIGVVNYDPLTGAPFYLDKFVGNPVLRNRRELDDVLQRSSRVWFLATPLAPTKTVLGEDLFSYIHESMTLVTEASNVRLYLWENQLLH